MFLFLLQLFDLLFDVLVVLLRLFVLGLELQRLLIMLERVRPILQLLLVAFLSFAALIKGIAEVVMALTLQLQIR